MCSRNLNQLRRGPRNQWGQRYALCFSIAFSVYLILQAFCVADSHKELMKQFGISANGACQESTSVLDIDGHWNGAWVILSLFFGLTTPDIHIIASWLCLSSQPQSRMCSVINVWMCTQNTCQFHVCHDLWKLSQSTPGNGYFDWLSKGASPKPQTQTQAQSRPLF